MIRNPDDLRQSVIALSDLYQALAALRSEFADSSLSSFALLAEGPLQAVAQIQADIDAYTGVAEVVKNQASLWIRLVGPRARWGETPSSVLTAFLDALRKGVQSIATSVAAKKHVGRPTAELHLACDFEVAQFAEGSFEIGVRLPAPDQGDFFPLAAQESAQAALQAFLATAAWAARSFPQVKDLEKVIPDARARRVALRAVKSFVPRNTGGVHFVELYGAELKSFDRIHLTPQTSEVIAQALAESFDDHEVVIEGEIREMDLDRKTFRLLNVPSQGEVRCRFSVELLPIAAELLGKRVRVIGLRRIALSRGRGQLMVTDIEKIEIQRRSE